MTTPFEKTDGATDEALAIFVTLEADQSRDDFVRAHPQLLGPSIVPNLADEATRCAAVNLEKAEEMAAAAAWLAEHTDVDLDRGRALRAVANVSHYRGNNEIAFKYYEASLAALQRAGDEEQIAITRSSGLQNLVLLGKYEQAFRWVTSAKEVFQRQGNRLRLARLDLNYANILFRQDRWEEAAERYEAAYKEFLHVGEAQDIAIALRNMAVCHSSLNNFLQALRFYENARAYCVESDLAVLIVEIDYNIAYLYYLRGEYTRAIELYQTARVKCSEIGERYHMALCDMDQAEIFLELNLVSGAEKLARQAFASFDELGVQYESAKSLTFLAIAVSREGRAFLALELLGKAREIFVQEENRVWPGLIDLYQAVVMFRAGRPLEAARLARSAREIFRTSSLPTKAAICEVFLARLYLEYGDARRAREQCEQALDRLEKLDVPAVEYQAHFVMGQIEEAGGDGAAAIAAYSTAESKLRHLRSHLQTDELKVSFLEDKLVVYESLVWLSLQQVPRNGSKREIFEYFEKAKARSLADLMAFRAHALPVRKSVRSEQAKQVRELREELNWYYRQIDLQEMRGDDQTIREIERLRKISRQQEGELLETLRELETADREYSSLQTAATEKLEVIQAAMAEDTVLLEYYFCREAIYAGVLTRSDFEIVPVTVLSRVHDLHQRLQFQLSKFRLGTQYVGEFSEQIEASTLELLKELYIELIKPVESLIQKSHLVVVPHGFLHYLPFHALFDGEGFLVDRYSVSYAPSASVFHLCCTKEVESEDLSLVVATADEEAPHVLEEARAVAAVVPNPHLLVGPEATEAEVRALGLKCRILYIATHKFERSDNPMFSSIELGASHLNLSDLYNLKLNAELVILSGCGTALESIDERDEIVGLTRGLFYAGAASVLISLWDLNDGTTSLLMSSFFRLLEGGSSKAQALQGAMQEVRSKRQHPYYWAPFILVGKPD